MQRLENLLFHDLPQELFEIEGPIGRDSSESELRYIIWSQLELCSCSGVDTPQSRTIFLVIIVPIPVTVSAVVMVVGHRVVEPVQPGVKRLAQDRTRYIVHGRTRSLCFELLSTNDSLRMTQDYVSG